MRKITITIYNSNNEIRFQQFSKSGTEINKTMQCTGVNTVYLGSRYFMFEEGDVISVLLDVEDTYVVIQLDPTLAPSLVYCKDKEIRYQVPFNDLEKGAYKDGAFGGERLLIRAYYPNESELLSQQNLAFNAHDQHLFNGGFPHTSANVETRNDSTFFARNAIDGIHANDDHGLYPYQSWGINQNPDAEFYLDFGRIVSVNKIGIVLRADFPHDSWWKEMTVMFSDGSTELLKTRKTDQEQLFEIDERLIDSLVLKQLIKGDDALYPALTQICIYGKNIKEN